MAQMIPEAPSRTLPQVMMRVFRFLKTLPDGYRIWHHLAPWEANAPDFLIVDIQNSALLIKVSSASQADANAAAQMLLMSSNRPATGKAETQVLTDFANSLGGLPLTCMVLFPNIPEKALQAAQTLYGAASITWWGQEVLNEAAQERWQQALPSKCLSNLELEQLRLRFSPEVVVPAALTVRPPIDRRIQAGLSDYLLDYDQESAMKADLDLNPTGQHLSKELRTSVINGVAGSGKTLILLYRLRLLHAFFPNKRFLVLTHNRPLNHDLKARYERLTGALPRNIKWYTFYGFCRHNWPEDQFPWKKPIGIRQRENIANRILQAQPDKQRFFAELLLSEIDWFKDQTFSDLEEYLTADRRGRGFRLSSEQRQRMAGYIQSYQQVLEANHWVDWGDVPRLMWKWLGEGQMRLPQYDVILIDEAQFFAPIWFEILLKALTPRSGHLFIVADPTQGFLGRGTSWKALGLEVRGRTHHLQRSYRTTREILNFATLFYRQRQPQDDPDEEILTAELDELPGGSIPTLLPLTSPQDEIARVANEIEALVKQGLPPGHILVLHHDWQCVNQLLTAIQMCLGKGLALDPKEHKPGDYVRVTTLNAGTGLEAPIVFLVGLRNLFEHEQALRISEQERETLISENTRKIYMAITRAGQRLVITYAGKLPELILQLLAPTLSQQQD